MNVPNLKNEQLGMNWYVVIITVTLSLEQLYAPSSSTLLSLWLVNDEWMVNKAGRIQFNESWFAKLSLDLLMFLHSNVNAIGNNAVRVIHHEHILHVYSIIKW